MHVCSRLLCSSDPRVMPKDLQAVSPPLLTPSVLHLAGIGKALAKRLASQGLNVVLVALPDALLQETNAELSKTYPNVTFRAVRHALPAICSPPVCIYLIHGMSLEQVGANLGKSGYLPQIQQATADIDVQIVFCNAGYMITGFFESKRVPRTCCLPVSACHANHADP